MCLFISTTRDQREIQGIEATQIVILQRLVGVGCEFSQRLGSK